MREIFEKMGPRSGRKRRRGAVVVRHIGESLVKAMEMALQARVRPEAAQVLVADGCVVLAETKDHLNWE